MFSNQRAKRRDCPNSLTPQLTHRLQENTTSLWQTCRNVCTVQELPRLFQLPSHRTRRRIHKTRLASVSKYAMTLIWKFNFHLSRDVFHLVVTMRQCPVLAGYQVEGISRLLQTTEFWQFSKR